MPVDFNELFHRFTDLHVGVIGDVMLDTYWWGKVDRISPEAPVPVVAVSKREQRIGGAGNVALNVRSLGATVSMLSVLGKDAEGEQLTALLNDAGINTKYIVESTSRITTNKIRIISRNQQMMRLDAEHVDDMISDDEQKLLYAFESFVAAEDPDVVILEDYNKGVLTSNVITAIIDLCKKNNIITAVDPKRKNFFAYNGVDIFKPNLKEVKARSGQVIAIANEGDHEIRESADHVIYVPETTELLLPILEVVPLQLLAYHIAVRRGCDVDQPRNLAKSVTVE